MTDHAVLDSATIGLIELAAAIAQGEDGDLRDQMQEAVQREVPALWVEELLLQSALIAGWPRALTAASQWRKVAGVATPEATGDLDYAVWPEWTTRGEATCRVVYGDNFTRLRESIRGLHPAFDAWMITEAYGRTMSRPGLDLKRRELCTIVQTAVLNTPRQLHSHLRGALHAGATFAEIEATLGLVNPFLSYDDWKSVKDRWEHIRDAWSPLA